MVKNGLRKIKRSLADNLISGYFIKRYYQRHLCHKVRKYPGNKKAAQTSLQKVLQISTFLNQGGAARISYCLSDELRRRGIAVSTIVADYSGASSNIVQLKRNQGLWEWLLYLSARNKGWLDFANLSTFEITNMSAFLQSDLIHLHNLHGNYFNPFILPEMTALKPTVWTLHDMQAITGHCAHSFQCNRWQHGCGNCPDLNIYPAVSRDETAFLWETKRKIYEVSEFAVVCPSNWLKQQVSKSILHNKEVHLIYNGVDTDIFKPASQRLARERLKLPQDKKILLFSAVMGSENPWKGGQYLKDTYEALKDRPDLLFLNIGGGGAPKNKDSNWRNLPYINDQETMAMYYRAADLFVYPSLADNCPLVVLEAMGCGLPVVSFKTGGIPEIITQGEDGYLAEYKNKHDFVKGILAFLDNEDLMIKAKGFAPRKISEGFSLVKMTEHYLNLYEACYYRH